MSNVFFCKSSIYLSLKVSLPAAHHILLRKNHPQITSQRRYVLFLEGLLWKFRQIIIWTIDRCLRHTFGVLSLKDTPTRISCGVFCACNQTRRTCSACARLQIPWCFRCSLISAASQPSNIIQEPWRTSNVFFLWLPVILHALIKADLISQCAVHSLAVLLHCKKNRHVCLWSVRFESRWLCALCSPRINVDLLIISLFRYHSLQSTKKSAKRTPPQLLCFFALCWRIPLKP